MAAHGVAPLSILSAPSARAHQRRATSLPVLPVPAVAAVYTWRECTAGYGSHSRPASSQVGSAKSRLVPLRPAFLAVETAARRARVSANAKNDARREDGSEQSDRSSEGSGKSAGRGEGGSADGGAAGDAQMQQLLADLVQLQSDKVKVQSFVDERSQLLTGIAESATAEYAKITEGAKRSLEEASNKVLEQVDAEAEEFEKQLAAAREDMERSEREFDEFEKSVEERRNSLLFFKQLYRRPSGDSGSSNNSSSSSPLQPLSDTPSSSPSEPQPASSNPTISPKEQALKAVPELVSANQKAAASPFRRKAYAALVAITGLSIAQGLMHEPKEWLQLAASGLVFAALLVQSMYERRIAATGEEDSNKIDGKD